MSLSPEPPNPPSFASRAGLKLHAALQAFGMDVTGYVCADLGCSTGGFTDCLLQHGAKHVYAVDTAYGELAWKLRQDARVTVMERSNALHTEPAAACDLVTIDLGWTPQAKALPAAGRWLNHQPHSRVITLIKPHYEASGSAMTGKRKGKLGDEAALAVTLEVLESVKGLGFEPLGHIPSPIRGGKGGNVEYLALLKRSDEHGSSSAGWAV